MDITQIQGLIWWLVGTLGIGLVSIATGVYAIFRSKKMLPKELKSADLTNEEKEVDLAKLYKGMMTDAALEAIEVNKRLKVLEDKVQNQEEVILGQSNTIRIQTERIDSQDRKIEEQSQTIAILECKLNNSEAYNKALIDQMQRERITPVTPTNMDMQDCDKISRKKKPVHKE